MHRSRDIQVGTFEPPAKNVPSAEFSGEDYSDEEFSDEQYSDEELSYVKKIPGRRMVRRRMLLTKNFPPIRKKIRGAEFSGEECSDEASSSGKFPWNHKNESLRPLDLDHSTLIYRFLVLIWSPAL
jgi:hypothetical protein